MRDLRIRGKLLLLVMLATGSALLVAGILVAVAEVYRLERQLRQDKEALARIVAYNVTAALTFDDPETATEVLGSLRAKPHVIAGCIYDEHGELFASYSRGSSSAAVCPANMASVANDDFGVLQVTQPVLVENEPRGQVLLRSVLTPVWESLQLHVLLLLAAVIVAGVTALALSMRLQRTISEPLTELARIAGEVTRKEDYSIRAERHSRDELGDLVSAFNIMLDAIESRDSELMRAKQELEARVVERTQELAAELGERRRAESELAEGNRQLAASNRELDDFAYVASHDLKEPLRGIHNYAGFLLEDYEQQLGENGRAKLQTLMNLARRMEQLIDTLLEYSRVGRVDLAVKAVDLNQVVTEVVDSLKPTLAASHAEVRIAEPLPTVRCDAARIGELFANVVINGIKYNESEAKRVEIGALPPGSSAGGHDTDATEGPIFYVSDNGIGIPEKHQHTVFDIFKRLHPREAYGGGTGAGLTIAKKVVERHGGRIWLRSALGQGTTFYFTLKPRRHPTHA